MVSSVDHLDPYKKESALFLSNAASPIPTLTIGENMLQTCRYKLISYKICCKCYEVTIAAERVNAQFGKVTCRFLRCHWCISLDERPHLEPVELVPPSWLSLDTLRPKTENMIVTDSIQR